MPDGISPGGAPIFSERPGQQGGPDLGPEGGAGTTGGRPIGAEVTTTGGLPIRADTGVPMGGRPVMPEPEVGLPGASILAPASYFGSSPVGGPASIFNIGGAPIAILGGVFGDGLPIGGPVSQVFRTGAPIPNTLFLATLESGGPIGAFFIGNGGAPIGEVGVDGAPIGVGVGGDPIGMNVARTGG
jgi:hypothetical protein